MTEMYYPHGCRPISADLGPDELIRRLKLLTASLQELQQDDGNFDSLIPLALYIADDVYIEHPSKDVQLLIACCIADMLRLFAPDAPYKDSDSVLKIFTFIINNLDGLRDPKDPAFKRYFYLLENIAFVKSFNMCFDIEQSQAIFIELFEKIFKVVSDEHSSKVKSYMLDVLCPIISETDHVSSELLEIILIHVLEPKKTVNKNSYYLAKEILIRTQIYIEPYIVQYYNNFVVTDDIDRSIKGNPVHIRIYELLYELYHICPNILKNVLPKIECKVKTRKDTERLQVVSVLARMFSEKNSKLAEEHPSLYQLFLERSCDISVHVRVKFVQSTMHFLLNHPKLRQSIIDSLRQRQHDPDYAVRYEVIMAVVETAKRDFTIVCESEDLLNYVKERTLDKKFKIRKEAMSGLALIYKKYLTDINLPEPGMSAITWIKDKILHGYYMTGIEDRLLVERLLITCLVPYQLPADDRMNKLMQLLATIDENAIKAFIELQKSQLKTRKLVSEWIKLHSVTPTNDEAQQRLKVEMNSKCVQISRQLTEPIKTQEYLKVFSDNLRKDPVLLRDMERILKRDISCKECTEAMGLVLKKLGQPIMTNLYYNTVKMLLERIASVMVDKESVEILVKLIEQCLSGDSILETMNIPPTEIPERGLKLLTVLSYVFAAHFHHESVLNHLLSLLGYEEDFVAPSVLKAFTYLGRYKPLIDGHHEVLRELSGLCKELAMVGTPKQAKHAVRCMYVNTQTDNLKTEEFDIFNDIISSFRVSLMMNNSHQCTGIVALGHIAYNMPTKFQAQIKNYVSRKLVKDLLVQDTTSEDVNLTSDWCDEEQLPQITKCKVEALKTMARWLLGLKNDMPSALKTFRMLNAMMTSGGDILNTGHLHPAEKSWLRLSSGKAMLKICEQKGVGDQFSPEQFYVLSTLMVDPVPEVREIFAKKLHKGLNKGGLFKSLPLDFMGFYVLAGGENQEDIKRQIRNYIDTDISRRRDFLRHQSIEKSAHRLPLILPDYSIMFAIAILTHHPHIKEIKEKKDYELIYDCLWLLMEPLITNKEFLSYGFFKNILDRMKHHKDAYKGENPAVNNRMWTICDIALHILNTKAANRDAKDFTFDATAIPHLLFQKQADHFKNDTTYIPDGIFNDKDKEQIDKIVVENNTINSNNNNNNNSNNTLLTETHENDERPPSKRHRPNNNN